jgi:phosphatidyl-myo-inositol dimannoside synthase
MSRRPRLLVLTPAFSPQRGGIELLTQRLAEHVTAFDVTVAAPPADSGQDPGARYALRRPARGLRLRGPGARAALNVFAASLARSVRPDVVLNMHVATAPAAWLLRAAAGAPYVQYVFASELPVRPRLTRAALTRAAQTIALSGHGRALAVRHGADPRRTAVVPPGVDQPVDAAPLGQGGSPTILAVSRMHEPYKGHDTLIRALPLVHAVVPEVRCHFVGEGRLRPAYERLAAAIGADSCCTFTGALDDAGRAGELRGAGVFCLPARELADGTGEGFGIAFLEAAAYGLPVVAGRAGGAVDAVRDGVTGVLVDDPADHVALAAVLSGLLADEPRRRALGEAGRRWSREFTWKRAAERVDELCLQAHASAS